MSYDKVNIGNKQIKINTICAGGFLLASALAFHNTDIAYANNKNEPVIKVMSAKEAAEHEDDPNALAALTFAAAAVVCAQRLSEKKDEKDNRKAIDRFMYNFKDGMSL